MSPAESAAYAVANQQLERIQNKERTTKRAISFIKTSFNFASVGFTALTALILTLIFWPAAVVFLLLIIALN